MDDREFVDRLRREDAAAVRHLSECLLPSVWRFVYFRVKKDQHLAEDIVGETVLALIKAVKASETEVLCPGAWMRSVAAHKIQDHFRAVARVQHLIDQATSLSQPSQSTQPAGNEEANEQRATVRRVMDDLPEPYRLALEWKYIEHLTVQQIADRMAITEKAVESILFRARREFREGLGTLHRDDVPFRLNGSATRLNKDGQRNDNDDRSSNSGHAGNDLHAGNGLHRDVLQTDVLPTNVLPTNGMATNVEAQQPTVFDELKQQQK